MPNVGIRTTKTVWGTDQYSEWDVSEFCTQNHQNTRIVYDYETAAEDNVYCQLEMHTDRLDDICKRLALEEGQLVPIVGGGRKPLEMAMACAVQVGRSAWYRGEVVAIQDAKHVKVRFVDYGYCRVRAATQLRHLPPWALLVPPLALRCRLQMPSAQPASGCDGQQLEPADHTSFQHHMAGQRVDVRFSPTYDTTSGHSAQLIADIRVNDGDVTLKMPDFLAEATALTCAVDTAMTVGSRIDGYATCAVGALEFYAVMAAHSSELDALADDLAAAGPVAERFDDCEKIVAGIFCLSFYDDSWYRGRVVSINRDEGNASVFFLDYGNTDTVPLRKVQRLPARFLSPPPYSLRCRLVAGACQLKARRDANETFERLALNEGTLLKLNIARASLSSVAGGQLRYEVTCVEEELCEQLFEACKEGDVEEDVRLMAAVEEDQVPEADIPDDRVLHGFVSHVERVDEFWLQSATSTDALEALSNAIGAAAAAFVPMSAVEVKVGRYCLAQSDGAWYRGVIETMETDQQSVRVQFVDFGNASVVPIAEVMTLLPRFYDQPKFALHVKTLYTETPVADAQELLKGYEEIEAAYEIVDASKLPHVVLLPADVKSALYRSSSDEPSAEFVPAPPAVVSTSSSLTPPTIVTTSDRFEYHQFAIPRDQSTISGLVSNVNGSRSFFIQREDQVEQLEVLSTELQNKAAELMSCVDVTVGTACLAKFDEDEMWYRAQVETIDVIEGTANVLFVDFGNTAIARIDELLEMSDELKTPPLFCVKAQMFVDMSEEAFAETFESFIEESCEFRIQNRTATPIVVTCDCESIVFARTISRDDITTFFGHYAPYELPEELLGDDAKVITGFVSHADSLGRFFVQPNFTADCMVDLSDSLQDVAESFDQLNHDDIRVGQSCVAKFAEDESWYRALVLRVDESAAYVRFVDFGNCADVAFCDLRRIPTDYLTHRLGAVEVGILIDGREPKVDATELLMNTAGETEYLFTVVGGRVAEGFTVRLPSDLESILLEATAAPSTDQPKVWIAYVHESLGNRYAALFVCQHVGNPDEEESKFAPGDKCLVVLPYGLVACTLMRLHDDTKEAVVSDARDGTLHRVSMGMVRSLVSAVDVSQPHYLDAEALMTLKRHLPGGCVDNRARESTQVAGETEIPDGYCAMDGETKAFSLSAEPELLSHVTPGTLCWYKSEAKALLRCLLLLPSSAVNEDGDASSCTGLMVDTGEYCTNIATSRLREISLATACDKATHLRLVTVSTRSYTHEQLRSVSPTQCSLRNRVIDDSRFTAKIFHVNADGSMYGALTNDKLACRFQNKLGSVYHDLAGCLKPLEQDELVVGAVCLVYIIECFTYFRARFLEVPFNDGGRNQDIDCQQYVELLLVDFGDVRTVPIEACCRLIPSMCETSAFALHLSLSLPEKRDNELAEEDLVALRQNVVGKVLDLVPVSTDGDVETSVPRQCALLDCDLTVYECLEKHLDVRLIDNSIVAFPIAHRSGGWREAKLLHVESTGVFSVAFDECEEGFPATLQKLVAVELSALEAVEIATDRPCLVSRPDQPRGDVVRGVIEVVRESDADVHLVDYGYSATIEHALLYCMPTALTELPRRTVKCRLAVEHNWPEVHSQLKAHLGRRIRVHIRNSADPYTVEIEVASAQSDTEDVSWQQINIRKPNGVAVEPVCIGWLGECVVTSTDDKFHVYLRRVEDNTRLESLNSAMRAKYSDLTEAERCDPDVGSVGLLRLGNVVDATLLRAEVIDAHGDFVTVRCLDTGERERVLCMDLFELSAEFLSLPALAIRCRLANVRTTPGAISQVSGLVGGRQVSSEVMDIVHTSADPMEVQYVVQMRSPDMAVSISCDIIACGLSQWIVMPEAQWHCDYVTTTNVLRDDDKDVYPVESSPIASAWLSAVDQNLVADNVSVTRECDLSNVDVYPPHSSPMKIPILRGPNEVVAVEDLDDQERDVHTNLAVAVDSEEPPEDTTHDDGHRSAEEIVTDVLSDACNSVASMIEEEGQLKVDEATDLPLYAEGAVVDESTISAAASEPCAEVAALVDELVTHPAVAADVDSTAGTFTTVTGGGAKVDTIIDKPEALVMEKDDTIIDHHVAQRSESPMPAEEVAAEMSSALGCVDASTTAVQGTTVIDFDGMQHDEATNGELENTAGKCVTEFHSDGASDDSSGGEDVADAYAEECAPLPGGIATAVLQNGGGGFTQEEEGTEPQREGTEEAEPPPPAE